MCLAAGLRRNDQKSLSLKQETIFFPQNEREDLSFGLLYVLAISTLDPAEGEKAVIWLFSFFPFFLFFTVGERAQKWIPSLGVHTGVGRGTTQLWHRNLFFYSTSDLG